MGSAGSVALVCAFSLVGGISNGIECYATMTAIQERTAQTLQARVGAVVESVVAGATGIGFLLGGIVATLASARAVYIAAGLGILALAIKVAKPQVHRGVVRLTLRALVGGPVSRDSV